MMKNLCVFACFFLGLIGCGSFSSQEADCAPVQEILSKRDASMFSSKLKDIISVITLEENVEPVGSFSYLVHQYPSDIDLREVIVFNGSRSEAQVYFTNQISDMARRLKTRIRNVFFIDFKAGFDPELQINIGSLTKPGVYEGYNLNAIRSRIKDLYNRKIISAPTRDRLNLLAKENPSYLEWVDFDEAIRQLYTLRWTLDEVIAQRKMLSRGRTIYLKDALSGTLVKLDVAAPVRGAGDYVEVSNFMHLKYMDNGQEVFLTQDEGDFITSIFQQIEFFSAVGSKSLKIAKRMWILAREKQDYELLYKLTPLMSSNPAALNQVAAEAEVLGAIAHSEQVVTCDVFSTMIKQMCGFSKRVTDHSPVSEDTLKQMMLQSSEAYGNTCFSRGKLGTDPCVGLEELGTLRVNTVVNKYALDTFSTTMKDLQKALKPVIEGQATTYLNSAGFKVDKPESNLSGRSVCPT